MTHRTTSWNAPYTFSGKEKDVETGYGYFGARYYYSGLSIWLSVDPMSDKYPNMSPYNYCANNPVKLIDPNGMEIDEATGPKDPPNLQHPNRDTFFDPKDDNQRNQKSSSQSESKTTPVPTTSENSSQNNSSNNKGTTELPKLNIPKDVSNILQATFELLKTSESKVLRSKAKGYLFVFSAADIYDNCADAVNGKATGETYYNLALDGVSMLPLGFLISSSIDSYKRGGEWLINYMMEFEASLQKEFNPANW